MAKKNRNGTRIKRVIYLCKTKNRANARFFYAL